jgi:hypothetical protein
MLGKRPAANVHRMVERGAGRVLRRAYCMLRGQVQPMWRTLWLIALPPPLSMAGA